MPKLQFVFPDGTEARYSLEGESFKIGRAPDNDIVIPDPRVSSHHLVLNRARSGDFVVNDLGATNPTRVNGRASQWQELQDGDTLLLGDTYARYESKAAVAPAAAQPAAGAVPGRPVPGRAPAAGPGAGEAPAGSGCFALVVGVLLAAGGIVVWAAG
jgi:hypothetical protein